MKTCLKWLFYAALAFSHTPAHAQSQPELEALVAPIALYPDPLLSQILMAATFPDQVAEAAQWSRAYPQLQGDEAVRAVQGYPWDPSVKALIAVPDLLARMAESPQWTFDLGNAFLAYEPQLMDAVQVLRSRASASGYLRSNAQQSVQQQGPAIVVQPLAPQVVYAPYYDPFVVYGAWWVSYYRPVHWRPWIARPVFVSPVFFHSTFDWPRRNVRIVRQPTFVRKGPPSQAVHLQQRQFVQRVPESQRQPIIQSAPRLNWRSEFRHERVQSARIAHFRSEGGNQHVREGRRKG